MLLMHAAIQGRKDIQPAISFLSQRANACTDEDCDKLRRLMRHIAGTMGMMTRIGATDLRVMIHFADAACFRSHTGEATTLGYSVVCSMSSKQKTNTSSSARAKLVGVSDYFPKLAYSKLFLEAQGADLKRNIVF